MQVDERGQPSAADSGRGGRRLCRLLLGAVLGGAAVALVVAFPSALNATWNGTWAVLQDLPMRWIVALSVVWIAGLAAHSLVLSASMPGLTSRHAMGLNLAGSAVANAVPMGGPLSMGMTSTMARSWGHRPTSIATFLTISNLWNLLARLLLGVVGLGWWLSRSESMHPVLLTAVLAPVVLAAVGIVVVLWSDTLGGAAGRIAAAIARRLGRRGRAAAEHIPTALAAVRADSVGLARRSWLRLTLGMVGYFGLLALLLDLCLRALHAGQPASTVVALVALERLLTAVPVTPGAAGVAELGLAGAMVLAGIDPALAAAATVLYRCFTFALEIPVGALVLSGWALGRRLANRRRLVGAAG